MGNFYQTEKDNEFCCETCPDEELKTKRKVDESNRLSIAQRIALFEKTETSSVLKKSLSDEEKTKSLNRQLPSSTSAAASVNSHALNNFLTSQIDDDDEKTNESQSSESESDDELVNDDKKLFESKSDHNSISNDNNVISTKELTMTTQAHQNESQEQLKQVVSDIILDSSNENVDDIELEFEKLAEEAVNNPIPLLVSPNIIIKPSSHEIVEEEKIEITELVESQPQDSIQEKIEEEKVEMLKVKEQTKVEEEEEESKSELIEEEQVKVEEKPEEEVLKEQPAAEATEISISSQTNLYPDDLNPFDEDEEEKEEQKTKRPSLNPFGSCSEDEEEEVKRRNSNTGTLHKPQKPPRPPLPRVSMTLKPASTNPFGSDDEDEETASQNANKTPVPTPRKQL